MIFHHLVIYRKNKVVEKLAHKFFNDIWVKDPAGNYKKAFYLKMKTPSLYKEILDFSADYNFLPFHEKCFLYRHKQLPVIQDSMFQQYNGMTKGYSKKFIRNVEFMKKEYLSFDAKKYLNNIFESFSCIKDDNGKISQLIQNHDRFEEIIEVLNAETSFLNELTPMLRHRIFTKKHGISEIPYCKCGKKAKLEKVRGSFGSTCGNKKCVHLLWNCTSKRKKFTMPSGLVVKVQGFENIVIKELLKFYSEDDIVIDDFEIRSCIGIITYKDCEGKLKKYYPDIYIKSERTIIEVKSDWTFDRRGELSTFENNNFAKANAAFSMGLNFIFWVIGNKSYKIKFEHERL
jgi:hypothetical protein